MHGHKKGHCKEFVKSLDIFGTSVDFSFKNSHSFGTCGGFCLSILIVAFMIFYAQFFWCALYYNDYNRHN